MKRLRSALGGACLPHGGGEHVSPMERREPFLRESLPNLSVIDQISAKESGPIVFAKYLKDIEQGPLVLHCEVPGIRS